MLAVSLALAPLAFAGEECAFPVFAPDRGPVLHTTKGLELATLKVPQGRVHVGLFWEGTALCVKSWLDAKLPMVLPALSVRFGGKSLQALDARAYRALMPAGIPEADVKMTRYWTTGATASHRGPWWTCFESPRIRAGDRFSVTATARTGTATAAFVASCWSAAQSSARR